MSATEGNISAIPVRILVNELDLKISTNYDILSVVPNYNANITLSNSF